MTDPTKYTMPIIRSVEASPEIPFSPARRPRTQGLLKNKVGKAQVERFHSKLTESVYRVTR